MSIRRFEISVHEDENSVPLRHTPILLSVEGLGSELNGKITNSITTRIRSRTVVKTYLDDLDVAPRNQIVPDGLVLHLIGKVVNLDRQRASERLSEHLEQDVQPGDRGLQSTRKRRLSNQAVKWRREVDLHLHRR